MRPGMALSLVSALCGGWGFYLPAMPPQTLPSDPQGRLAEALEIVEEALREAPDFLEGHVTPTRLYLRLRRTEDAQRHREIVDRLRAQADSETAKKAPADRKPF